MFLPFKTILEKRARRYSFWPELLGLKVCQLWQEEAVKILGKENQKSAQPLRFRGGVLEVKIESPILSQELRLHETDIKKKINTSLRAPALKRIIYKVGYL